MITSASQKYKPPTLGIPQGGCKVPELNLFSLLPPCPGSGGHIHFLLFCSLLGPWKYYKQKDIIRQN